MNKLTVTSEELKRMAEQSYKRLGGVAQPDARVIRGLLARIQELETAGRPFADLAKYYNGLDDEFAISIGTLDAESIFFTVGELRQLAVLLNNSSFEKE